MINSFPSKSSMSPFRKSFHLDRDEVITTSSTENATKKKRQSLRIITGGDSHQQSPTSSISSPSRVRQRLSSLFRSSSPVVMTLKETFSSSNNLSQDNLNQHKRQSTFSSVSFASVAEQLQEQTPTLMQSLDSNNSSTTLSSSSEASDHMPASPADGSTAATANSFTHHHHHGKSITDPSFWQPVSIKSNMMSLSYHAPPSTSPPSPPPHRQQQQSSLAFQVYQILGSTLDEVDEEIEQDWEYSRNKLRQSLVLPKTCERIY